MLERGTAVSRIHRTSLIAYLLVLAMLMLAAGSARASQVRPINLEQMSERAAKIFTGRCLETSVTLDPQLGREITVVTFAVEQAFKGETEPTVTIKMIDGIAGLPRFNAGEEVILFLYEESALGLSSPVGLGQGRFKVVTDKLGRRIALNDFANANLLRGLTPQAETRLGLAVGQWKNRKDLEPEALVDMVEKLVNAEPADR